MLSLEDVVEIIRVASAAKVSSLRFGGLSLTFEKSLDATDDRSLSESTPLAADQPTPRRPTRHASPTDEELRLARERLAAVKAAEEVAKVEEQVEAREMHLANLAISDPMAFEDALCDEAN